MKPNEIKSDELINTVALMLDVIESLLTLVDKKEMQDAIKEKRAVKSCKVTFNTLFYTAKDYRKMCQKHFDLEAFGMAGEHLKNVILKELGVGVEKECILIETEALKEVLSDEQMKQLNLF
jgi:hypothetical protein